MLSNYHLVRSIIGIHDRTDPWERYFTPARSNLFGSVRLRVYRRSVQIVQRQIFSPLSRRTCVATTAILANKELFLGRFLLLDFQFARISKRDTVSRLMFLLVAINGDRNRPAYREFRTGKYVLCVNWEDSVQGQGNRSLSLTIASCYILLRTAVYYFICIR